MSGVLDSGRGTTFSKDTRAKALRKGENPRPLPKRKTTNNHMPKNTEKPLPKSLPIFNNNRPKLTLKILFCRHLQKLFEAYKTAALPAALLRRTSCIYWCFALFSLSLKTPFRWDESGILQKNKSRGRQIRNQRTKPYTQFSLQCQRSIIARCRSKAKRATDAAPG